MAENPLTPVEENAVLRHIAEAVAQLDVVETMEDYLTCPFACGDDDSDGLILLGSSETFHHAIDCPITVARYILNAPSA